LWVVHDGYFSQDKKGRYKDTKGDTKDDYNTYNTIMKDKEWLLSFECPLRIIFSHSALKEGWNTNFNFTKNFVNRNKNIKEWAEDQIEKRGKYMARLAYSEIWNLKAKMQITKTKRIKYDLYGLSDVTKAESIYDIF